MRALWFAACAVVVAGCTCATTEGVLYQCSTTRTCEPGFACGTDSLCHPVADAGSSGGGTGGSTGGGTGGSTGGGTGGSTGGGTGGSTGGGTGGSTGGGTGGSTGGGTGGATGGGSGGATGGGTGGATGGGTGGGTGGAQDAGPCRDPGTSCGSAGQCCMALCTFNACQIPGGVCASATALALDGGFVNAFGNTATQPNVAGGASCDSAGGGEAAYSFTIANGSAFFARVSPQADAGSRFSPVMYLRSTCSPTWNAADLNCVAGLPNATGAFATQLTAGTYTLFVDSQDGGSGPYDLTVNNRITGDNCTDPLPLVLTATGPGSTAIIEGDSNLTGIGNDVTDSCGGSSNDRDMVVTVSVPSGGQIDAWLTTTSWDGVVSIWGSSGSTSCTETNERDCANNTAGPGTEHASTTVSSAGTYSVWISGTAQAAKGPFSLKVRFQ